MSGFMKLFGGGAKDRGPNAPEAIQKLRDTCDMLQKKSEFLEKKIEAEVKVAKQHGTKNKRMAINALKRKKRYEKQLQNVDGTLSTVEFQLEALQNAQSNKQVLDTMKVGAQALKKAHGNLSPDDVHDLMDDITDQQEVSDEITTALSSGLGHTEDIDEDELMAELEELEQEEFDEAILEIPTATDELPDVPSAALPSKPKAKKQQEEDDELAELQMWAS
uniref:Charged multivesicular body protein 4b-like n=1 Tax=Phallusia mammillata TaxID=59560 RepID=A0A6F9DA21_9ASCI|nr:charged multivesicular body protein 4b-like [Phallusia mammillata]